MADLILRRRLSLAPSSFNREAGTVEAVLSSGAGVQRRDARGAFTERLATTAGAVTLHTARLPILDSHRQGSIADVLGFVADVRHEAGEVRATLHITSPAALSLIETGALTGVSIGYRVAPRDWIEGDGGRTRTAMHWTLLEVSLVPVPADPGAILRSESMPDGNITELDAPENRAEVNASIRSLATRHALGTEWANGLIDRAASVEEARAAALDELDRRAAAAPRIRAHQTGESNDDPGIIATRCADALAHRMGGLAELPEPARQFRGMGLHDMLRTQLAARGERVTRMNAETLIRAGMTTGDLPALLTSAGNRTLMAAYQPALSPVFAFFRRVEAQDFRPLTRIRLGEMDPLVRVPESGEIERGGFGEGGESYGLATFARIVALSRNALINDDLGAFAQMAQIQGRAAAEKQNAVAVDLLTTGNGLGPTMEDGNRFFHTSHGNVAGSGGAPDATTLAAAVQAMRVQKGVDGISPINVTPRYLLVSPAKETQARQAVSAFYPATSSAVNPLAGTLGVLVEPRLSGNRWYVFADPGVLHSFEYAVLASAPGPQMETRPGWDVLGAEFRVVLDFGCGAVDWRGSYSNAGA